MTECCGFLIDSINDQSTVNLEIDGDGAFFFDGERDLDPLSYERTGGK